MSAQEGLQRFDIHRAWLLGLAYRMLGSRAEAQDVLQEAWLRFQTSDTSELESDRAWLTTVVTRLCLDALKLARTQREHYVGPWLPEPWLGEPLEAQTTGDAAEQWERTESLSLALLLLLETLTPLERAVFVLHEALELSHAEIAQVLERDSQSCRQLLHRAREQVAARRPRFASTPEAHQRLVARFVQLAATGDFQGMTQLFAQDVRVTSDGGGKVRAALNPIHGPDAAARLIKGLSGKLSPSTQVALQLINGRMGLVLSDNAQLLWVIAFECDDERVFSLQFIGNPEKLSG